MIQRIQSLYLAGIFIIASALIFINPLIFEGIDHQNKTENYSVTIQETNFHSWLQEGHITIFNALLIGCISIAGFLALISVFLYKNLRIQQILTMLNFIFIVALFFSIYLAFPNANKGFEGFYVTYYTFPLISPVLMLLFNYLALRNIKKDRELLASSDRLR